MICKNCGITIDSGYEDKTFCRKCGASQLDEIQPSSTRLEKKAVILIMVALVAVIALFVFAASIPYDPPFEVIPMAEYTEITYIGNNRFFVQSDDGWGIRDVRGRDIISLDGYEEIERIAESLVFAVRADGEFHFLNSRGSRLIFFDNYDHVEYANDNRFIVRDGSRVGVVDVRGRQFIELGKYSRITASDDKRWYFVWDGDEKSVLNSRGREVIPFGRYDYIRAVNGGRFIAVNDYTDWAVLDSRGNEIIPLGSFFDIQEAGERFFIARDSENQRTVLDLHGNAIIPSGKYNDITYAGDGLFIVIIGEREDSRLGVADAQGREIIEIGKYSGIEAVPNGRFIVRTGNRAGVVDMYKNYVIEQGIYDDIESLHWLNNGFGIDDGFIVIDGDSIGAVDINGRIIIPMGEYNEILGIHNSLAIVGNGVSQLGVINTERIEMHD
jgi:hypothetical protein